MVFSDERFLNLMNLQTIYVLKTCNCTVAFHKAVGIINIPFLLLYLSECGASFKASAIDVNEQNSCQEVAIFTVLTSYQSPKLENLTLNLPEFWYMPKVAACPIGLLMININ